MTASSTRMHHPHQPVPTKARKYIELSWILDLFSSCALTLLYKICFHKKL